jgi:transcriptional repressor NrdR
VRCPYCSSANDRVVDSRSADGGAAIRRRRECRACGQRFSTYERAEQAPLAVRKRDGELEPYDRTKVLAGIEKATKNLALETDAARRAAAAVEARLRSLGLREVASEAVGAAVLDVLRDLDPVAYMRFASVYKGFQSPEDFRRELAVLEKARPTQPAEPSED